MDQPQLTNFMKLKGIALTGSIATGKSTVAAILRELGYHVIDADQLARAVVAPGSAVLASIAKQFGLSVIGADGHLDRSKLRNLVFADVGAKEHLEAIMHPAIRAELYRQLEALIASGYYQAWFYEAALIFEKGLQGDFSAAWVADCPQQVQLQRLMQRDQLDQSRALSMIQGQMPQADKRQKADVVINTALPRDELRENLRKITATL